MKKRMMNLLLELLKDSKRSDRELAKVLDVSQPTVSRMRSRLVKEGIIRDFTVIPDFVKMGFEIMAITCVKIKEKTINEMEKKAEEYMKTQPNIIFAGGGAQGMGKNGLMISLHDSYSDFSNFLTNHMMDWGDIIEDHFSILVSLRERIVKPFSLKYLAEKEET
ncbi:MAG: Lrp/AsnC family transcriptional regulator [Candidatus Bathyarchaeia archaeon]